MELGVNKKICLINQPAGIGDVFFLQKMIDIYINKGFIVIYPIIPELNFIKDYIKKENLIFCSIHDNFPYKNYYNNLKLINEDNFVLIPATYADRFYGGSCMESKYTLINDTYENWQNHFIFERNTIKENQLFYDVLKLNDDTKYTLVSKNWGTPPNYLSKPVYHEFKDKIVEFDFINGYTLFDWCKVIENAHEISIVDTSINYIIEKLNLKTEKLFLTSRFTPANFSHIINLFNKKWKLIK